MMRELIYSLRRKREEAQLDLGTSDVFDLMELLACSACCTQVDGGNKTCPPKLAEAS
jgi:hypothetical protein